MSSTPLPKRRAWQRLLSPLVACLAALQFLTILPPLIRRAFTPEEMGRAAGYFPLAGALIGLLLVGTQKLAGTLFPQPVSAALILAIWVGVSGALHLDGFLDACDGLLGGHTPEERLTIMRDERMGAFAFAGGALLLLLKYSALSANPLPLSALLLAPSLSRWGMALAIFAFPYARSSGVGLAIKEHCGASQLLLATASAGAIALLFGSWRGLIAMALVGLVVWAGARFSLSRLPGLTGDIYGALNELGEAAVLLAALAGGRS